MVTVRESVEMRLDAVLMVFNVFWFFCPLCSILLYGFVLGLGLFVFFFLRFVVSGGTAVECTYIVAESRHNSGDVLSSS